MKTARAIVNLLQTFGFEFKAPCSIKVFSHLVHLSPANALGAVQLECVNKHVISDSPKRTYKQTVLRGLI